MRMGADVVVSSARDAPPPGQQLLNRGESAVEANAHVSVVVYK
jgi:hypothetical protein